MKDKICFVCLTVTPGGGNKVIFELAEQIENNKDLDYEIITIQSIGLKNSLYSFSKLDNLKITCLGFNGSSKLLILCNLIVSLVYIAMFGSKYKMVIINSPLLSPIFGLIPRKNIYNYIQADDYRIFDTKILKSKKNLLALYKWVTKKISYQAYKERYIFNSHFTYNQFKDIAEREIRKINLVLPGVDLNVFQPFFSSENPKKIVISTILRKQPWKGSVDFIKAINRISSDIASNCDFIGITNEDISSLDVPAHIKILRPNSDEELANLLQKTDIFIVTSHWEGFGLPGLEAMACGCTLVSTQNGGCLEYAIDGTNCFLYQHQNIDRLSSIIIELISNQDSRKKLSTKAIESANKFSWENSLTNLLSFL
jgi:glycosyltransferase involved in cell wall biosynthesis